MWAVQSPVLCLPEPALCRQLADESEALFARLRSDPGQLPASLWERRRVPIGRYFESLIAYWLEQVPSVTGLRQNLAIHVAGRTLGELDLLFEREGQLFHWELAVKLYLGTEDGCSEELWLGPRARDRLDKKLAKLHERQLPLFTHSEAQAALEELGLRGARSEMLVKGILFHPHHRWRRGLMHHPPTVNAAHERGWWLRVRDAGELAMDHGLHYQELEKPDWLGPARKKNTVPAAQLKAWLHARLDRDSSPPLVAVFDDEGKEQHRGFVVPDDWGPEAA